MKIFHLKDGKMEKIDIVVQDDVKRNFSKVDANLKNNETNKESEYAMILK